VLAILLPQIIMFFLILSHRGTMEDHPLSSFPNIFGVLTLIRRCGAVRAIEDLWGMIERTMPGEGKEDEGTMSWNRMVQMEGGGGMGDKGRGKW